jgi:hypothetical protein
MVTLNIIFSVVAYESGEFQKLRVEGFKITTVHFRGIYGIYFKLVKKKPEITTCS